MMMNNFRQSIKASKHQNIKFIVILAVIINGLLIYSLVSKPDAPDILDFPDSPRTPSPKARETLASFSIEPSQITTKVGQPFDLTIRLESKFPLTGADAVLKYNPNMLKVKKIRSGTQFELYPRLLTDESRGLIIITGINTSNNKEKVEDNKFFELPAPANSRLENFATATANVPEKGFRVGFATITLLPLSPGETALSFDFLPGKTNTSTAIRETNGENILTHTKNVKIKIQ